MAKLFLVTSIDTDFNECSPRLLVANTKEEAKQRFLSEACFVYDFEVEEVEEVDGCCIRVLETITPIKENQIGLVGKHDLSYHLCGRCKTPVEESERYCSECGVRIGWGK